LGGDLAQAEPLQADLGKDEPHGSRLLRHHLEAGNATPLILGYVTVTTLASTAFLAQ
jgi:hypothetical protein